MFRDLYQLLYSRIEKLNHNRNGNIDNQNNIIKINKA